MKKYIHYIPMAILLLTLPYKFSGNGLPYLVEFFDGLTGGYGDFVMAGIGLQELVIIAGLFFASTRKYASFGAIATMLGAIATHFYLGAFDIVFIQAIIVLATSAYIFKNN